MIKTKLVVIHIPIKACLLCKLSIRLIMKGRDQMEPGKAHLVYLMVNNIVQAVITREHILFSS